MNCSWQEVTEKICGCRIITLYWMDCGEGPFERKDEMEKCTYHEGYTRCKLSVKMLPTLLLKIKDLEKELAELKEFENFIKLDLQLEND